MKKRNLKNLQLSKSTISNLQAYAISGGTDAVTADSDPINVETRTGCSGFMKCNSIQACPKGVAITKFVDTETNPASLCTDRG